MPGLEPKVGCLAVIFTSILLQNAEGYDHAAQQMVALASNQPGFMGIESFRNHSGFGLTICYWQDDESLREFRDHFDHLQAQAKGKTDWYQSYTVTVARVERTYGAEVGGPSDPNQEGV